MEIIKVIVRKKYSCNTVIYQSARFISLATGRLFSCRESHHSSGQFATANFTHETSAQNSGKKALTTLFYQDGIKIMRFIHKTQLFEKEVGMLKNKLILFLSAIRLSDVLDRCCLASNAACNFTGLEL